MLCVHSRRDIDDIHGSQRLRCKCFQRSRADRKVGTISQLFKNADSLQSEKFSPIITRIALENCSPPKLLAAKPN